MYLHSILGTVFREETPCSSTVSSFKHCFKKATRIHLRSDFDVQGAFWKWYWANPLVSIKESSFHSLCLLQLQAKFYFLPGMNQRGQSTDFGCVTELNSVERRTVEEIGRRAKKKK